MWPEQADVSTCYPPETPEEVLTTVVSEEATCPIEIRRFASLPKLINVTKLVIKFTRLLKRTIGNRKTKNSGPANSENVEVQNSEALRILIGFTQSQYFPEELSYLNKNSHKIPARIKSLGLFLDENGLLRCTGRLQNADHLPYSSKFPLLLPPNSPLTGLIVIQAHENVLHAGVQDTICKVREEYWIPRLRQCVKKMKTKCHLCNRLEGPALRRPPPPPLPACRVNSLRPFEVTGVDLTGQILICNPATKELDKVYIVVFTCTSTRACHLEVVKDLTSTAFLNSFRRFTARRSCPRRMISDNATNFKTGSSLIQSLYDDTDVQSTLTRENCKWTFITPRAPHQGGFYERMVGSVKSALKKAIFKKRINSDELNTIVTEIERRINNRPLTYVDATSPDTVDALTPSHLLYGYRLNSLPTTIDRDYLNDPDFELDHKLCNERFKFVSQVIHAFQEQWEKEYLQSLRDRHYFNGDPTQPFQTKIKVGDVVLVHNETPRCMWKLARVIQLMPSSDGLVRVVKLQTSNGETTRSVDKLYPLEVSKPEDMYTVEAAEKNLGDSQNSEGYQAEERPKRRAATNSRRFLQQLINDEAV
ncbi:uncharacterized protein LOC135195304 [Macrobrachium nipponense]|uniref:uncharacterized protein LOC135195304 n=1 Tax=Macrobrachium nipponense TaxID=159736 RepID=UPI0030C87940